MTGPLAGVRVVELQGLGPGPYAGMLLADLGADVVQVGRAGTQADPAVFNRGKRWLALDLKDAGDLARLNELVDRADVLVEGFRPGVVERLGVGPDECLARNPRLVFVRLTGYGQDGPYAHRAGHDLNYLALAGALEPLGRAGSPPTPPINVLADFAGGGMLAVLGAVAALYERAASGRGQVVDAAMVDGAAMLLSPFYNGRARGSWGPRGTNSLDTGSHFYDVYETADGQWLSIAAIEPQFYAALRAVLGLPPDDAQLDADAWPAKKKEIADVVRTRSRDEWVAAFADVDACVEPVLTPEEAPSHPHHVARGLFVDVADRVQPVSAPRFGRTSTTTPPPVAPASVDEVLDAWSAR